jgi:hypothetical protein
MVKLIKIGEYSSILTNVSPTTRTTTTTTTKQMVDPRLHKVTTRVKTVVYSVPRVP